MVYFTLFGILVGYLSFVFYTSIVTNNMKNVINSLLSDWLEVSGRKSDIIESFIGKPYNETIGLMFPFVTIFGSNSYYKHYNSIDLYYFSSSDKIWFKLDRDKNGLITRAIPTDEELSVVASRVEGGALSMTYSPFFGRSDKVCFWINLTSKRDKNIYIAKLSSCREGIFAFIGSKEIALYYTLFIIVISFLLSKWIAYRISKPITELSVQTKEIASGNIDMRIKILSKDEIGELSSSINTMADSIRENINDMKNRMEAISVMNTIDKAVLSSISHHDLIDRVTFIVSELFNDCTVSLAIADLDNEKYITLSHYMKGIKGFNVKGKSVTFNDLGLKNVQKNKEFYIIDKHSNEKSLAILNSLTNENFLQIINLPIFLDEEYVGSLIIGRDTIRPFSETELDTLKALADQTGVAMKNVRFLEDKEKLFLGVLMALSKTIDTKSKWTSGHSERVAFYSERLAIMMEMEDVFLKNLRISASLHDIGKIGVPESILDKPGFLDSNEFNIIKKHPQDGALIVEEIPGYEEFIKGILFHHESWDGSGYPFGLEGRAIPLMGRLIAVADVFDSLTSERPYRGALNIDEVVNILTMEKGKKLDPNIVNLMIQIIESEIKKK